MGGRSRAHATRRDANHDARNDAHGRGRGDTHGAHRQRGARARSTAAAVRGASRRGGGHLGIDVGARIPRATRAIYAGFLLATGFYLPPWPGPQENPGAEMTDQVNAYSALPARPRPARTAAARASARGPRARVSTAPCRAVD